MPKLPVDAISCEECLHAAVCPIAPSIGKFMQTFQSFWTPIHSSVPVKYPICNDMSELLAKHCRHYGVPGGPILA